MTDTTKLIAESRARLGARELRIADGLPASVQARFWSYVVKGKGCWTWSGAQDRKGYGRFHVTSLRRSIQAHRVSFWLHFGQLPQSGLHVCHRCDNPPCVRPDHLFVGTPGDNVRDAKVKGRLATGKRHGMHTHPETRQHGQANAQARLTDGAVQQILALRNELPIKTLACRFDVSRRTIQWILEGKRWSRIERSDGTQKRFGPPVGEQAHGARLNAALVRTIRARAATGTSFSALAREHGVGVTTIRYVVRRETWRHVP